MELARRLGIQRGQVIAVVNEPPDFWDALRPLPKGVEVLERATRPLDVLVYFSDSLESIERRLPAFEPMVAPGGSLWVGHPPERFSTGLVDRAAAREGLATAELLVVGGGWSMRRFAKRSR
ncbi:MAG: hypothetical protein M3273_08635 [Actinomycetota bacterium]|nr:hypothetical protein [Actinomycetota bacterium]